MGRNKTDLEFNSLFRNQKLCKELSKKIREKNIDRLLKFMEVCGTHTVSFFKFGLRSLLPDNIKLISGPGCPVCVTPVEYIDKALYYMRMSETIIATFGDIVKVPGSCTSIFEEKSKMGNVKVVYSPLEALELAHNKPLKKIIFLAIGFETTAPLIASTILKVKEDNIKNFYILCGHKLIPPAMYNLLEDSEVKLDGFLCPGHVSTIIGTLPYRKIANRMKIPCVIAGFEAYDIMIGIYMLLKQVINGECKVQNQYTRCVTDKGNVSALEIMNKVFQSGTVKWRGLGEIPQSGLVLREEYVEFDIENLIPPEIPRSEDNPYCICADVIKGTKFPPDCKLFSKICTPDNPQGPCMISAEGTCAAWYKYSK